jgi:hypothetical protein
MTIAADWIHHMRGIFLSPDSIYDWRFGLGLRKRSAIAIRVT